MTTELAQEQPNHQQGMDVADRWYELLDDELIEARWLDEHLINDHGRAAHEITRLPLHAVHDLEHFDETMGLLALHHRHTP